jgi:hypothetical protein
VNIRNGSKNESHAFSLISHSCLDRFMIKYLFDKSLGGMEVSMSIKSLVAVS